MPVNKRSGEVRRSQATAYHLTLAMLALALAPGEARAQADVCEMPGATNGGSGGSSAAQRLRDRDPLVREMARADVLSDQGHKVEAAAIYRRLASTPPDRRQTARRANLRLAEADIAAEDFAAAESHVALAARPGAPADIAQRVRKLRATIAFRRGVADSEAALDRVDTLVAAGRTEEAVAASRALMARPCPRPPDYRARVQTRLARIYRASGDFATARTTAIEARSLATTPNIQRGAELLLTEIDDAERLAMLRERVAQANGLIDAGNAAGAVAMLEPMLASQPPLPPEIDQTVRLRLARAYVQTGRQAEAVALVAPLRNAGLAGDDSEAVARIYLARASGLQQAGANSDAVIAYRDVVDWEPALGPETRESARLGLGRSLAEQGERDAALQQVSLVRMNGSSPELKDRATRLYFDIRDDPPFDKLYGYAEAGVAWDSNAPTLVSAVRDEDEDLPFPPGQRFSDEHAMIAARLQYRKRLAGGPDYIDFGASGLRTFQRDLTELDRTRVEFAAAPVFVRGNGKTELRAGGQFVAEWRGGKFRSSAPGAHVGIKQRLSPNASVSAVYSVAWRNDYRDERDGVDHALDTQLRLEPTDADVVTIDLQAEREGGKIARVRNWGLLAGAGWRHRFNGTGRVSPYVAVSGDVERVRYSGLTDAIKRRDWRVKAEAAVGVEIDRTWRAQLHYAYYDVSSNVHSRERRPNHQAGVTIRYTFN